jgi:hypothetical protein
MTEVRDVDRVWVEDEDGAWFRLADILYLTIERGVSYRAVAVMRYRYGEVEGSRDDRPVRFVLSTHVSEAAAREELSKRVAAAIGLPYYYEPGD